MSKKINSKNTGKSKFFKSKRSSNNNQGISRMFNSTTIIPARILISNTNPVSTTATIAELNLTIANMGDRIIDAGDIFSFFRVRKLHAYSFCNLVRDYVAEAGSTNGDPWHAVAFMPQPNTTFTAPTALTQLLDFPEFKYGNRYQKLNIKVGPAGLYQTTPTHWYETGTQGSTQFNSAGTVISYCASSENSANKVSLASVIIEIEVEFKEPIDTALIPLDKLKARVLREEKMLVSRQTDDSKEFIEVKSSAWKDEKKEKGPLDGGLLSTLGFR